MQNLSRLTQPQNTLSTLKTDVQRCNSKSLDKLVGAPSPLDLPKLVDHCPQNDPLGQIINDPSLESLVGCADDAEAGLTEDKSHDPREFDLGKQITTNELKAENAGLQVSTSFNDKCTSEPRFEGLDQQIEGLDQQIEGLDQQIEASELQLIASELTLEFSKLTINAFQRQTEALNAKFESFTFTNDREVKALALQHEALALKLEAIEVKNAKNLQALAVENEKNKASAVETKESLRALALELKAIEVEKKNGIEANQLFDLDDGEQRTRPNTLDNPDLEEQSTPKKYWLYFNSWPLALAAAISIGSIICLIILLFRMMKWIRSTLLRRASWAMHFFWGKSSCYYTKTTKRSVLAHRLIGICGWQF